MTQLDKGRLSKAILPDVTSRLCDIHLRPLQTNREKPRRFSHFILAKRTKIQGTSASECLTLNGSRKRDLTCSLCYYVCQVVQKERHTFFKTQSGDWLNMFIDISWRHLKKAISKQSGGFSHISHVFQAWWNQMRYICVCIYSNN